MIVDHPTFVCPNPTRHRTLPCCPCEHNLGGCCWHCPDVDEQAKPGTHLRHVCVVRP